jgi:hypothetical protein
MHGRTLRFCGGLMAVMAAITLGGSAAAQDGLMSMSEPELTATDDAPANANVPGTLAADPKPASDLEKRISKSPPRKPSTRKRPTRKRRPARRP